MPREALPQRLRHAVARAGHRLRVDVDQMNLGEPRRERLELDVMRVAGAQQAETAAAVRGRAIDDLQRHARAMSRE